MCELKCLVIILEEKTANEISACLVGTEMCIRENAEHAPAPVQTSTAPAPNAPAPTQTPAPAPAAPAPTPAPL